MEMSKWPEGNKVVVVGPVDIGGVVKVVPEEEVNRTLEKAKGWR